MTWKFGAAMPRHHLVGEHPGATETPLAVIALRLFVLTFILISLVKVRARGARGAGPFGC
jgi:hypothetical protein